MNRDYLGGTADNVTFFVGIEVEHTPAHGMKTLFVTGVQPVQVIEAYVGMNNCDHIFFGANHSYCPNNPSEWNAWDEMVEYFLKKNYLCSLDIPMTHAKSFLDGVLVEYHNFIPQLRIPLPYIKQWNYNTMIKLDDSGFNESNPGVWCHRLHNLMDDTKFTPWDKYGLDKILK
jgi:hypothetical protein